MNDLLLVLSTCPEDQAQGLARCLVEARLAACVNIISAVRSVYRWEGAVTQENEALLVIKTRPQRQKELFARLQDEHPYAVPEIISLPCDDTLPAYLRWVHEETTVAPAHNTSFDA